jgi:hypothetical protein
MQEKWQNGESFVLLNLLFHCTHQIFINHRRSAAPRIIMHIFASFVKVSHPSPCHWIACGMFSIHLTKFTMNVGRFHVYCIQETDYRPHFTCGGLLDFLENFKHIGRCVKVVWLSANCVRAFQKNQQNLHACVAYWPQHCSGNICKRNVYCGYTSYLNFCNFSLLMALLNFKHEKKNFLMQIRIILIQHLLGNVNPCGLLEIHRHPYLHGRRVNQVKIQYDGGGKHNWFSLQPWRWKWYVSPRCQWTSTTLQCVTSQQY